MRIANDIPFQSESLPLIHVYFIFTVVFTLVSIIWYVIANSFATKRNMPKLVVKFAGHVKPLFCRKKNKRHSEDEKEIASGLELQKVSQVNEMFQESVDDLKITENDQKMVFSAANSNKLSKVEISKDSEKTYEMRLGHFNYIVLFVACLIMAAAHSWIWILIST